MILKNCQSAVLDITCRARIFSEFGDIKQVNVFLIEIFQGNSLLGNMIINLEARITLETSSLTWKHDYFALPPLDP